MPNPFVGGRIPYALLEELERFCDENGVTKADVVREAIAVYLKLSPQNPTELKLTNLEEMLKGMQAQLGEFIA
jgi:hypothetical protein